MITKFDKGILLLIALICIGLFFSTFLGLDSELKKDLVTYLGMLIGLGAGKKIDSGL